MKRQLHQVGWTLVAASVVASSCLGGSEPAPAPTQTTSVAAQASRSPVETATSRPLPTSHVPSRGSPNTPGPTDSSTPLGVPTQRGATAPIAFSAGTELLPSDLAARGSGAGGRGAFNISRIVIRSSDIDAPVVSAVVGSDGRMPDPPSLDVVVWYDFSAWPGLGGLPGAGGNVVLAGDARKPAGAGVFSGLRAEIGDFVRLTLTDGTTACYGIEFKKLVLDDQFMDVISATSSESVTLITGARTGARLIFWGRRSDCGAEPAPAPTRAPSPAPTDRHKVKIVAENYTFTVVEGAVVPSGMTAVDFTIDHRDAGVMHSLAIYAPSGRQVGGSDPVEGPTTDWTGLFGLGPPDPPGEYTFRCQIHPQMTASITVLP